MSELGAMEFGFGYGMYEIPGVDEFRLVFMEFGASVVALVKCMSTLCWLGCVYSRSGFRFAV
jgi:hypothetical protein